MIITLRSGLVNYYEFFYVKIRFMDKYSHTYNVILDNMDMNEYRLQPISAIMYLQDCFARYTATKRAAAYDLFAHNLIWVVGEFNIEFVDVLPFWSEEIKIELWFSEITKLKNYVDYKFYYKDKVFAKGNSCWFLLNDETKRPSKTDMISEKFEVCEELALGEHKKFVLEESSEFVSEINHKNNLSDIDFNNHVNNKSYLKIASATASNEFKKSHTLKSLYIKFNKESFLDDVLHCETYKTNIQNTFIHKITKGGENICEIQTSWQDRIKTDENIVEYALEINKDYK